MAHISVEYYVRLEQARGPHPSPRILDGVAQALQLAPADRAHLFRLAETVPPVPAGPVRTVRPHVLGLLERMPETAAIVTDATYDVLAWNPLADKLLGGIARERNTARRRFLGRPFLDSTGWEETGHIVAARLRAAADRYPQDLGLQRLLADLRAGSAEFVRIWETHPVHAPGHRTKTIVHPEWGRLTINCDVLTIPEDDQQIVFITQNNRPSMQSRSDWLDSQRS